MEGGKPIKDARLEVSRAANTFAIAAREALRLDGEQLAMDNLPGNEARIGMVLREPLGVVAAVTPFNFPSIWWHTSWHRLLLPVIRLFSSLLPIRPFPVLNWLN